MSECVVRMEMPKACWSCGLRFVCKAANDFLTTKEAGCSVLKVGMEGCLILCQLPEGHGRLIDEEELFYNLFVVEDGRVVPNYDCNNFPINMPVKDIKRCILETTTIIPAERRET